MRGVRNNQKHVRNNENRVRYYLKSDRYYLKRHRYYLKRHRYYLKQQRYYLKRLCYYLNRVRNSVAGREFDLPRDSFSAFLSTYRTSSGGCRLSGVHVRVAPGCCLSR